MDKISPELKETLQANPQIKEVHFTEDGAHAFHKNKDVEYTSLTREEILGDEVKKAKPEPKKKEGDEVKKAK